MSLGLGRMLAAVGLALAGRAAARLAARLGLAASRSTLLRMIRRLPDPPWVRWRCSESTTSRCAVDTCTARC
jgi:hypothetical protein